MRVSSIVVVSLAAAGCIKAQNVPCEDSDSCNLGGGGACVAAPTGNQWCAYPDTTCPSGQRYSDYDVGDGLSGACVGAEPSGGPDAAVADANAPDGLPRPPIVVSGQAADIVLGAPLPTSPLSDGTSISRSRFTPYSGSLASDGTRLWMTDPGNNRVLQWSSLPTINDTPSNVVLGQASPSTRTEALSRTGVTISSESGVAGADGRVYVSDIDNHRVMVWQAPDADGTSAAFVVGQQGFTTRTTGSAANQLSRPGGIWTDGQRLVVVDSDNHRVLLWNQIRGENGQPADLVLGQRDFGLSEIRPVAANSLKRPAGTHFDGRRLYVVDRGNHRVLVWSSWPTRSDQPADMVIGQADFTANGRDAGAAQPGTGDTANANGLDEPIAVITAHDSLFIADSLNRRVLVWQSIPGSSGQPADYVLGAPNLGTVPQVGGSDPRERVLVIPRGLVVAAGRLFVSDMGRVLGYSLNVGD